MLLLPPMRKKKGLIDTLHTCQEHHLKDLHTYCRRSTRSELKDMAERLLSAAQHDPAIRNILRNATLDGGKLLVKISNREDPVYSAGFDSLIGAMQTRQVSYAILISTSSFSKGIDPNTLPALQVIQTINGRQLAKLLNKYADNMSPDNPIAPIVFQKHALEIIFLP